MIVGLGNPGDTYASTRHNAGFMVLESLSQAYAIGLNQRKFDAAFGRGRIEGVDTFLVKPLAYMNLSGPPVRRLADYFQISAEAIVILHDDVDLVLGRIKIQEKGGHGGHKGLQSLMAAFGGGAFTRIRLGIGRSVHNLSVSDHVLGRFAKDERELLSEMIATAREAVVTILGKGIKEGMNRFNRKRNMDSR